MANKDGKLSVAKTANYAVKGICSCTHTMIKRHGVGREGQEISEEREKEKAQSRH